MRKTQNFALPTISNGTYAGEAAADYIAAALLSAKTLDGRNVEIHPNVKYKEVIQKLNVSDIIYDASCDFAVSSSAVSITERVLEPKELQVNLELCKQNFLNSWEAISLGYSAFDEIPRNFTDYLVSYVGGKVAEATENSIWKGTATNGQFLGFEEQLIASSGSADSVVIVQSGSADWTTAITSENILQALDATVTAIPATVYGKEDTVIYIGTTLIKAFQQALGGVTNVGSFNNQLNVGEKPLNFNGLEIVHAPGMSPGVVIAGQKSNFHFGTGLMSDYNQVKVLDMADIDGSQNFRVIMRYTAGTLVGINSEVAMIGAV
jgi:hypothetical protein